MSSKTMRSLAALVLLLTAAAHASAAVLYTFSSQAHSGPSSDFSFVVDDLLTTTTIVEASDLFDVITYVSDATLGLVGFTNPQTNPNIFLFYPDTGRLVIYSRWPEPFTRLGSYTPGTGVTLVISSVSVPEPGTLAMLSLALAALSFTRRRRPQRIARCATDDRASARPQGVERDHRRS
jgi:PEP-CTERM motif